MTHKATGSQSSESSREGARALIGKPYSGSMLQVAPAGLNLMPYGINLAGRNRMTQSEKQENPQSARRAFLRARAALILSIPLSEDSRNLGQRRYARLQILRDRVAFRTRRHCCQYVCVSLDSIWSDMNLPRQVDCTQLTLATFGISPQSWLDVPSLLGHPPHATISAESPVDHSGHALYKLDAALMHSNPACDGQAR